MILLNWLYAVNRCIDISHFHSLFVEISVFENPQKEQRQINDIRANQRNVSTRNRYLLKRLTFNFFLPFSLFEKQDRKKLLLFQGKGFFFMEKVTVFQQKTGKQVMSRNETKHAKFK